MQKENIHFEHYFPTVNQVHNNDFEGEKDYKQLFVDLLEQALRFSNEKLAVKFQSLSLLDNYLLLDILYKKGYSYSLLGTSARSEKDYRMTMDELNRLFNNLTSYSFE